MKSSLLAVVALAFAFRASPAQAQTWPDYHLTKGNHYTSYGVETYESAYPVKNLYVDPAATLYAGATELDDIYDGNQVFLNGGTIYASVIDEPDFTWNSGELRLNGGTHSSLYGITSGTGKSLDVGHANLYLNSLAVPEGNEMSISGSYLCVGNLDLSAATSGYISGNTIEVTGTLSGYEYNSEHNDNHLILSGPSAMWITGRLHIEAYGDLRSLEVRDGAKLNNHNTDIENTSAQVSGAGSEWIDTGHFVVSSWSGGDHAEVSISDGAKIKAGSLIIGLNGGDRGVVLVTGSGSELIIQQGLGVGDGSFANKLRIENGGSVICSNNVYIRGFYAGPIPRRHSNEISVTGVGSRLRVDGTLVLDSGVNPGSPESILSVGSGGEIVALGGVKYWLGDAEIHIDDGGRLVIGSDFDASKPGFNFRSGGILAVEGPLTGLPVLEAGRRLEAVNVISNLTVHGTLAPGNNPAQSVVTGMLSMETNGVLEMELGGEDLGYNYDQLTVTGASALAGTLDVVLVDDYTPSNAVSFQLFNWESGVSGSFETINLPLLPSHLGWDTSLLYTDGILSVMPVIHISKIRAPTISLKSKGRTPVTIFSTDDFDATSLDPSLVRFAMAAPVHHSFKDFDGDGDIDLKLHFKTQDMDLDFKNTDAVLIGQTKDGVLVIGACEVRIVPSKRIQH